MTDSMLQRYFRPATQAAGDDPDAEIIQDYGAFGLLRAFRDRAVMLELRKKDGNSRSFGYAWLQSVEFDPSVGITLHLHGAMVKITGRNLNNSAAGAMSLLQGLLRHRVVYVQEADEVTIMSSESPETLVERLEW